MLTPDPDTSRPERTGSTSSETGSDSTTARDRTNRWSRLQRADPYLQLPEPIRAVYNRDEWMWLTDDQKANLIESECTPSHAPY